MLDRLCSIRSYLTMAVLIIAILIALLLQSRHGMSEDQIQQKFIELQQQTTLLQEMLNKTVENQQHHYYRLDNSVWSVKLLLLSEVSNEVAPVVIKMSSLTERVRNYLKWYSNPFFAFNEGYQLCLSVIPAHSGKGDGTVVTIYLHLMKGPHDDKLEKLGHWPLRGTVTIELLNQHNDSDHRKVKFQLHHQFCSECTNRVLEGVMASGTSHRTFLLHHSDHGYHISDSLFFKISFEQAEAYQEAPVYFRVTHFSYWLESKDVWYSPFLAFDRGYQMCFAVLCAGALDGEGTHVSLLIELLKGPHDDSLEQSSLWPFRGTFTIELLNQLNDSDHYSPSTEMYIKHIGRIDRVNDETRDFSTVQATSTFISHDTLYQHNGYLMNDMLYFMISYSDVAKEN